MENKENGISLQHQIQKLQILVEKIVITTFLDQQKLLNKM